MAEYSVELVIRLVAPRPWNQNTVRIVERILKDKAREAIAAANHSADAWTKHGEPVAVEVEFRQTSRLGAPGLTAIRMKGAPDGMVDTKH